MTFVLHRRIVPVALAAALVLGAAGCGGSSGNATNTTSTGSTSTTAAAAFHGPVATPPQPEAPLVLRNSLGKRVDLAAYKGKAVLLTFLYVHCPDVCPLIAGHLHTTLSMLGAKASSVKLVAVSTDPKGDTPAAVKTFLAAHQLTGKMDYLIGSKGQLAKVLAAWNITAQPDKTTPELIAHSALIYGISASGKVTVLYPSNFKPADIAHDVPLLASQ